MCSLFLTFKMLFPRVVGGITMQIIAEKINKTIGSNEIFTGLQLEVNAGEHIAIIGPNGCGKTTLLGLLAGEDTPDTGRIIKSKDATIGYLHQIPSYPAHTVRAVLEQAFAPIFALKDKMTILEQQMQAGDVSTKLLQQYGQVQEQFIQQGGYELDSQLAAIANGLGIAHFLTQPFEVLSGGEKTKVMLGQILLQNPSILLLDEPTNHLDMQAIEWLEEHVRKFEGIVIVVSHDRQFMNQVAQKIVEIEDGEAYLYYGNYDAFAEQKQEKIEQQFAQYEEQQKKIKKMQEAIKRLKQWANEANPPSDSLHRRAKSMEKALARMERVKKPINTKKMNLSLAMAERSGKEVVAFEHMTHGYERPLFYDSHLAVYFQDRLAIVGGNGFGKSTLLKMVTGEVIPQQGLCKLGSNVKIGYLSQQFNYSDTEMRVVDVFRDTVAVSEAEARHILAQFLFYGYDVFKKIKNLSGGEKMRLRLAQLMHKEINLLLLDEPTNHLDIESREVLEDTLESFEGTIIAVSHDRYFLQKLFTKIAWIEHQQLTVYDGDYEWAKGKRSCQTIEKVPSEKVKKKKQRSTSEQIEKLEMKLKEPTLAAIQRAKLEQQLEALYEQWLLEE